jgi:hypothetical protein
MPPNDTIRSATVVTRYSAVFDGPSREHAASANHHNVCVSPPLSQPDQRPRRAWTFHRRPQTHRRALSLPLIDLADRRTVGRTGENGYIYLTNYRQFEPPRRHLRSLIAAGLVVVRVRLPVIPISPRTTAAQGRAGTPKRPQTGRAAGEGERDGREGIATCLMAGNGWGHRTGRGRESVAAPGWPNDPAILNVMPLTPSELQQRLQEASAATIAYWNKAPAPRVSEQPFRCSGGPGPLDPRELEPLRCSSPTSPPG